MIQPPRQVRIQCKTQASTDLYAFLTVTRQLDASSRRRPSRVALDSTGTSSQSWIPQARPPRRRTRKGATHRRRLLPPQRRAKPKRAPAASPNQEGGDAPPAAAAAAAACKAEACGPASASATLRRGCGSFGFSDAAALPLQLRLRRRGGVNSRLNEHEP